MTAEETDASSRPGTPPSSPAHDLQQMPPASPLTKTSKTHPPPPRSPTRPLSIIDLEPFKQLGILPSLVAGWSAFPGFTLLLTIYLNILYTNFAPLIVSVESTPQSIAAFALITARVLFMLACCRNLIAFSWDMFVDSVRQRPTLKPLLLRNFREAARILGCEQFPGRLLLVLHLTSAVSRWLHASCISVWRCGPGTRRRAPSVLAFPGQFGRQGLLFHAHVAMFWQRAFGQAQLPYQRHLRCSYG